MSVESSISINQKAEAYSGLPRVRALQVIWEEREKMALAKGYPGLSLSDISQPTDEKRVELIDSVARLWASFELEVLRGLRADVEVAEGMATVLQGYRHELGFLDGVSARVDELLEGAP